MPQSLVAFRPAAKLYWLKRLSHSCVSVRHTWLQQQHPNDRIPMVVTHTMGGFARDVARNYCVAWQIYSHIAHLEALLQADRFFGVSLLLLQQTEASFLAAFLMAGGVNSTFELFTHEWMSHPARVTAAQAVRRLAGRLGGSISSPSLSLFSPSLSLFLSISLSLSLSLSLSFSLSLSLCLSLCLSVARAL